MRFQEQYERAIRAREKLNDKNKSVLEYEDDILKFFQECYAIKDWIKNDKDIDPSITGSVESAVSQSQYLTICSGIANTTKHLSLDQSKRSHYKGQLILMQELTIIPPDGGSTVKSLIKKQINSNGSLTEECVCGNAQVEYVDLKQKVTSISYSILDNEDNVYDAVFLADLCLNGWKNFLTNNNLL